MNTDNRHWFIAAAVTASGRYLARCLLWLAAAWLWVASAQGDALSAADTTTPSIYAETKPFPAPADVESDAHSLLGRACGDVFSPGSTVFPGFEPVIGFSTVIGQNTYVVVRAKSGARFAFLLSETDGDLTTCQISDVVALPAPKLANAFLQCHLDDPPSLGFGMRLVGKRQIVAYWTIDADRRKIDRVPLSVPAVADKIRCQEPETGE